VNDCVEVVHCEQSIETRAIAQVAFDEIDRSICDPANGIERLRAAVGKVVQHND